MTLQQLSTGLETIAEAIAGVVFLRATDADANMSLDDFDMTGKTVVIFNNLPTVPNTQGTSTLSEQDWPIDIRVLQLANLDDTTVDGDKIRDECAEVAYKIFDRLGTQFTIDTPIDSHTVDFLDQVSLYDKILTGCKLTFNMKMYRTSLCQ